MDYRVWDIEESGCALEGEEEGGIRQLLDPLGGHQLHPVQSYASARDLHGMDNGNRMWLEARVGSRHMWPSFSFAAIKIKF